MNMTYGHYITDTLGNRKFFIEGCSYCNISTSGQHMYDCPCKDLKIAEIRHNSFIKYDAAWKELSEK